MSDRLEKPIFFIGMPRSGTTVVFELFAAHDSLGWITNYSARFPRWPIINVMRRILGNPLFGLQGKKQQYGRKSTILSLLPKPQEGYPFWQEYCGIDFLWEFHLREKSISATERNDLRNVIKKTLLYQGKHRFATKLTGPARIAYLTALFPDAMFVHVIRDGRAVVDSLMRVGFWRDKGGLQSPFWRGALTESDHEEWVRSGYDPILLASLEWRNVIECTRQEAATLEPGRYREVRYEDFVDSPRETLKYLYEWSGLNLSEKLAENLKLMPKLENMNYKYLERPSVEIDQMNKVMSTLL